MGYERQEAGKFEILDAGDPLELRLRESAAVWPRMGEYLNSDAMMDVSAKEPFGKAASSLRNYGEALQVYVTNPAVHGERKLTPFQSKDLRQVVGIPVGHATAHGDAFFVLTLLQQADGEAFEPSNIVRRMAVAKPTFVFAKRHIETPVQRVFNAPVTTNGTGKTFDTKTKEPTSFPIDCNIFFALHKGCGQAR